MTKYFQKFLRDDSGATAIEYGLIAALIGVVIIGGASIVGTQLNTLFSNIGSTIAPATGG